jgi:hypothetical protein
MNNQRRLEHHPRHLPWLAAASAIALLGCALPEDAVVQDSLTATAPAARDGLRISPVLVSFPVTRVGQPCERSELFTVSNPGSTPVTPSVHLEGDAFHIAHDECGELLPAQSCTIEVRFTPVVEGPSTGTIEAVAGTSQVRAALIGLGERAPRSSPRPRQFDLLDRGSPRLPAAP